jgi:hypothetical protein
LDDAYITYRYARNLATGRGFVYNPGEAVLGTTAPLYGLLLAALHVLGVDIPQASHLLGVVGWAACALLVERISCASREHSLGLPAASLVATSPLFLQAIGMETNLTIAVALGAIYLYLAGRTRAAFLLAALATWMRPDCALVAIVLGAAYLWEKRALPWREAVIFVATLLPWLVFAQLSYGSVFPNSLFAKVGQGHRILLGGGEFDTFGWGLIRLASNLYSTNKLYVLIGAFSLIGLVTVLKSRSRWLIVVAWAGLYVISYILLAVIYFTWYYPPVWPAVSLLASAGVVALARWLCGQRSRAWRTGILLALVCLAVLVPQLDALRRSHATAPSPYYLGYVAVADWLRANTAPDASVAMIEIGIIGYYSDRRVVDAMGLVSPGMVGHLYSWDQTLLYALTHYWPDYAIALEGTAWGYIKPAAWFREAYVPVAQIPSAGPGSRAAKIYKRAAGFPIRSFEWARPYDLSAGDGIGLSAIRVQSTQLKSDMTLHAQIEWRARRRIEHDYKVLIDLISLQDGRRWPLAIEQPMHGGNPTFLWQPGEVILDDYSLLLPAEAAQGAYLLEVKLLNVTTDEWPTFTDAHGQHVRHVAAGPLWVGSANPPAFHVTTPLSATFSSIEFLGFDMDRSSFAAEESVPLTLYWRASQLVDDDYTVFVHISDAAGNLVAQQDSPPLQGNLPTSLWSPGITVEDRYQIALPLRRSPGEYTIKIGLYQLDTGERLMPFSSAGEPADRALEIAHITVH